MKKMEPDDKGGENAVKVRIQIIAALCALCLLFSAAAIADESNSMREDGYSSSYSYTYDYWGDVQISPDPYRVARIIDTTSLDAEKLEHLPLARPQGFFIRNQDLYLADTGNNRIIRIRCEEYHYSVVDVIREFSGDEVGTFSGPTDVFVDENENLYVADYGNHRVLMLDRERNLVKKFTKPADATFNQDSDYLPSKITVDSAGRVYVLAVNVNKGFLKYESDTTFTGYIGANTVKINMTDYIWKRYFMTAEQRAASESFVPTEYENLAIDDKGFIYATTTVFNEYELMSDSAKPIRRLNSLGNDILIKNDRYPPIGDLDWKAGSVQYGPSRFADITSFENEIYVALDRTRGRLFGYDSQGVMLWAFGTKGNRDGSFNHAIALDRLGYDLYVMDDQKNSITVFTPTEYGKMIYDAVEIGTPVVVY